MVPLDNMTPYSLVYHWCICFVIFRLSPESLSMVCCSWAISVRNASNCLRDSPQVQTPPSPHPAGLTPHPQIRCFHPAPALGFAPHPQIPRPFTPRSLPTLRSPAPTPPPLLGSLPTLRSPTPTPPLLLGSFPTLFRKIEWWFRGS